MLKDTNEQGLVSLTVPPCCWNLQLIHNWEPYINIAKSIRAATTIMKEIKMITLDKIITSIFFYLLI